MAFSTGRGGAGNIHYSNRSSSNTNVSSASKQKVISPTSSHDGKDGNHKKVYYSTGRGGVGNIQSSDSAPSPTLVPQGSNTPTLHTEKVSTGRGGYGNMISNDDPALTRKLQDVDGPEPREKEADLYAVASNKSFSVGRGGFGNVISKTKSQVSGGSDAGSNNSNNLYTISSHGERLKKNKEKKKGIFNKIKEAFN